MTGSVRREGTRDRTPARRRLREGYLAAAVPVIACLAVLCGLTAWTATGAAGTPPRVVVDDGRVLLPAAGAEDTSAFFRITNLGGADDELVAVTSPAADRAVPVRDRSGTGSGDGATETPGPVRVPAGGAVDMTPLGTGAMVKVRVKAGQRWQAGQVVPFVLHFRHGKPVGTIAIAIRPGS
ncbi:copper chaperone PCu(A)C [Streptomyces sp. SPB4]|uniref:copper chaperone PCu(A)C n=1 Tax=Streptomyces TaxID=1883 RepID=UPI0024738514|nr:copper chaperone PCu(A)C [Streptomyces sp. SPB4]MDH6545439.1 copper(I)-binding protein [Streptomyces sp. SPB4]